MNASVHTPGVGSLRFANRVALQWRLLLLWTLAMLLPAALMVWPFWATMAGLLDSSIHAAQWAQQLDAIVLADLISKLGENSGSVAQAGMLGLALTLLLSPLLAGAIAGAASAAAGQSPLKFKELVLAGAQRYGRMFRMLLWGVVPLGLAGAVIGGGMAGVKHYAESAILYSDVELLTNLVLAVGAIVFLLAHLTLDAGRAQLAVYPSRTSAVKAWWRGCKGIRARFWFSFLAFAGFTVVGLALALAITALRVALPQLGFAWLALGLVLAQAAVVVIGWMRIARLVTLIDIAQGRRNAGV